MTLIIDVDAHAEPAHGWLNEFPALRDALPPMLPTDDPQFPTGSASPEMFAWFVAVDLLRARGGAGMRAADMVTPALRVMYDPDRPEGVGYPGADQHAALDADARVRWMDANGIAAQNLISGAAYTLARAIEDPALAMD